MNKPNHICHITSAHPMFDTRIFYRECVSLSEYGFNVTLIAPGKGDHQEKGVHILPIPKSPFTIFRRLAITRLAIYTAIKTGADLYHFHDPELIPAMRWLSRHINKPIIWDAHESYVDTITKFNFSKLPILKKKVEHWFEHMEISACKNEFSGVVTITDIMAQRYKNQNIPTCLLSNFIDLKNVNFPPHVNRSVKPRLINTGSLFLERGVMEMADAFQLLRHNMDCQVAFWGNFQPPNLSEKIRKRSIRGNYITNDDVLIGGPYPWKTLMEELIPTGWVGCILLDRSDRNACITHANRLFEYWANGLPVIANEGTETAKIVKDVEGGIVIADNDPFKIADAFRRLVKDRELAEKMGRAGRRAVEEKFNWKNEFPSLLKFYSKFGVNVP